jgi:hypothetical protein
MAIHKSQKLISSQVYINYAEMNVVAANPM